MGGPPGSFELDVAVSRKENRVPGKYEVFGVGAVGGPWPAQRVHIVWRPLERGKTPDNGGDDSDNNIARGGVPVLRIYNIIIITNV